MTPHLTHSLVIIHDGDEPSEPVHGLYNTVGDILNLQSFLCDTLPTVIEMEREIFLTHEHLVGDKQRNNIYRIHKAYNNIRQGIYYESLKPSTIYKLKIYGLEEGEPYSRLIWAEGNKDNIVQMLKDFKCFYKQFVEETCLEWGYQISDSAVLDPLYISTIKDKYELDFLKIWDCLSID